MADEHPAQHVLIPCPQCQQPSDSIKCYRLGFIVFLFLFAVHQTKNEIGCPSCIRKALATSGAINLITANILWPFIILPWYVILLICSFTKGHSKEVLKLLSE